jgi:hypothetical protein
MSSDEPYVGSEEWRNASPVERLAHMRGISGDEALIRLVRAMRITNDQDAAESEGD